MRSSLLKMYQIVNSANPKVLTRSLIVLFLQANEGLTCIDVSYCSYWVIVCSCFALDACWACVSACMCVCMHACKWPPVRKAVCLCLFFCLLWGPAFLPHPHCPRPVLFIFCLSLQSDGRCRPWWFPWWFFGDRSWWESQKTDTLKFKGSWGHFLCGLSKILNKQRHFYHFGL